jgi:saccharopine dehydrogenase-like NADP-dependent oxidoreductase
VKILIAGCGAQGGSAGGQFAKEKDVEQIICTDVDISRAKRLADRIKRLNAGIEISAEQVDFSNPEDLTRVAKGVDVIYNAAFPAVNVPILKACLDVGAHYIDLAAFPFKLPGVPEGETMEDLLALDDKAKAAGITAISNMGAAPGFSDIATHYIVNQLDTVDRVMLRWCDKVDATDLVATWWAGGIMGEWFSPPYPIAWDRGKVIEIDLLKGSEEYEFPPPVGKATVYTATFHPELFTISRFMPEVTGKSVNYIELKGGMVISDMTMKDVWVEAIRRAAVRTPDVEKANLVELFAAEFIPPADFKEACDKGIVKDGRAILSIEVTGLKDGRQVRHTVYGISTLSESIKRVPWVSHVAYITALTGVIASLMLGRGEIKKRGVGCAWLFEQPEAFLKKMMEAGIQMLEKIERSLY